LTLDAEGKEGTVHTDSGLWINVLDPTGMEPIAHLPQLKHMVDAVREGVYGGFPWMLPLAGLVPRSWYLQDAETYTVIEQAEAGADGAAAADRPHSISCPADAAASLELVAMEEISPLEGTSFPTGRRRRLFNFTAQGPDHLGLYLQPCLEGGTTVVTRCTVPRFFKT
jgi:hypothetical protein